MILCPGMVQLHVLSRLLARCNFSIWDFGMSMAYKKDLSGFDVPRAEWLKLVAEKRGEERTLSLSAQTNAAELLADLLPPT